MTLNWGDVPTWVASVGTVAAVSLALWQVRVDRVAATALLKRAQAELVAGWFAGDRGSASHLAVRNASAQPVYEVIVSLVLNLGGGEGVPREYQRIFLELPPGTFDVPVPSHWHSMSARPGVEVAFTDRSGRVHWIRRANGALEETGEPAIEHYGIGRPFGYDVAEPIAIGYSHERSTSDQSSAKLMPDTRRKDAPFRVWGVVAR